MSDEVAAPAPTEAAPVEAPAVEEPVQETPTGDSPGAVRQSARQQTRELGNRIEESRRKAEEARKRAADQPRKPEGTPEGGQFAQADAQEPQEPQGEEAAAAPSSESLGTSAEAEQAKPEAGAEPPDGMVRVQVPEGHWLRDKGITYRDVPPEFADLFKGLLNDATRRSRVAELEAQVAEMQRAERLRDAERRFVEGDGSKFWTPEHQQKYEDILNTYGEEDAAAYRAGQMRKREEAMQGVREEADLQAIAQSWQAEGTRFRQEAFDVLPKHFPGLTASEVNTALSMYAAELKAVEDAAWRQAQGAGMAQAEFVRRFQNAVKYSAEDFLTVAGTYLSTRPGVLAKKQEAASAQDIERRRIEAEVKAAEAAKLREASERHATNPHSALHGQRTDTRTTDTSDQPPDRTNMTADQIRRQARKETAELGRRLAELQGR